MEKKLYFKLSDSYDASGIVMKLSGCMEWIENDELSEQNTNEYTLTPIWLTDDEFDNLPEANV